MYELSIITYFSSAHNLRGYQGACENLHGHNWKVEIDVRAEGLDSLGMVVDFKSLRGKAKAIIDPLDHRYLNELPPFDVLNATAENIARHIYTELSRSLNDGNVKVSRVKVWESEKAAAAYYE
ncbi:MAG TPA: 6-carboxytetrahydropterin synthase QueD [Deltaproteobacteria bacterium]|nr:MAG: 6-carboxytetrahydropterin synthase QueD [Deltaproteobacteria bacterium GWA2_55_82]OGQ62779.1 MAG: 6-carboxytetrahydropterin synthase QueD [Deltaproteobacteria bacterium RIFCSPLOWO2_02_FULL_55_12]OIJ73497.1 MAG: 6-carboxytetrahydropterin synthase QueD [Deltaproteobacteria bacterium GWC2_55_46]HBG46225.1 6-carboxytetrahydropterin synthase QueD [Deltaproteobacteria bacterium]HCY10132.1 6-carboxytetrahydropterin synthase QueD [Deltaproteobacteria bacterium]